MLIQIEKYTYYTFCIVIHQNSTLISLPFTRFSFCIYPSIKHHPKSIGKTRHGILCSISSLICRKYWVCPVLHLQILPRICSSSHPAPISGSLISLSLLRAHCPLHNCEKKRG
uniref:Uncharacterized protein n=2 Tax=Opuntia streptacantha TaxID=393608 RepID=A0A7C9EDP3_OPUST